MIARLIQIWRPPDRVQCILNDEIEYTQYPISPNEYDRNCKDNAVEREQVYTKSYRRFRTFVEFSRHRVCKQIRSAMTRCIIRRSTTAGLTILLVVRYFGGRRLAAKQDSRTCCTRYSETGRVDQSVRQCTYATPFSLACRFLFTHTFWFAFWTLCQTCMRDSHA